MMNKIKRVLKYDYLYYILVFICLVYGFLYTNLYELKSKYNGSENTFVGIITEINIDGNKLKINLKTKEKLVANYYFKTKEEKQYYEDNLFLGDKVKIKGEIVTPKNNTVPNMFNYKKYLYNNKIFWQLNIDSIEKIENNTNMFYMLKNNITKKIEKYKYSKQYLYTFLLGDDSKIDEVVLNSYRNNGICHLFAVSGMHVTLITGIILFVLNKLKINKYVTYIICFSILFLYMFLTNFSPSILRATLFFVVLSLNKILKLNAKSLNIVLLIFCIIIIYNPFLLYNIGFQYSYSISFTLILFNNYLTQYKNYFSKLLIISLISFLVGLPITIYNFYQINLLSILLNIVFVPLISIIIFPSIMLSFFVQPLDSINNIFINILENLSVFISNIKFFNLIVPKPHFIIIILYGILIILILILISNKKYYSLLLILVVIIFHSNYIYFNNKMYMINIDVGQGDSSLVILPHNKGNVLIDTGGLITYNNEAWQQKKSNYSISLDTTIPLLKSLGIKDIDYLILTHGDYDHMGEAINLVENFKIEKIIFNCGEFNELEQDLIKVLDKKKIPYYSCIKELYIDDNKLYFLNNKDYGNENDNSSVIYTELNNHKFLFMGDAGVNVENDLIEKYNLQNIDVLKVGHHGSKTSSSKEFIDEINPKYSVISVGENNRYGHPNGEVLNILDESKIYRTDQDGSIMFKIKNNKLQIETCTP